MIFSLLRFIQTIAWRKWFYSLDFQVSPEFTVFLLVWFIIISVGIVIGGIVWLTRTSWRQLGWFRKGLLKAIGLGLLGFLLLSINVIIWSIAKGPTQQPEMTVPSLNRLLLVAFFAFGQPAWVEENLYPRLPTTTFVSANETLVNYSCSSSDFFTRSSRLSEQSYWIWSDLCCGAYFRMVARTSFKSGSAFYCAWIILGDSSIYASGLICSQSAPNTGST